MSDVIGKIEIVLTRDGRLQLAAPEDKIVALGMMEIAKSIILTRQPGSAQRIVVPTPVPPIPR